MRRAEREGVDNQGRSPSQGVVSGVHVVSVGAGPGACAAPHPPAAPCPCQPVWRRGPPPVWCTPGSDGSSENVTSIAQHVQRRDQQGGVVPRVGTGRCVPVRDDVESAFARASNQRRVTTPARLNGPWWGPLGRAIPR